MATKKKTNKKTDIETTQTDVSIETVETPTNASISDDEKPYPDRDHYYKIKEDELTPGMVLHWTHPNGETALYVGIIINDESKKIHKIMVDGRMGSLPYDPRFEWWILKDPVQQAS